MKLGPFLASSSAAKRFTTSDQTEFGIVPPEEQVAQNVRCEKYFGHAWRLAVFDSEKQLEEVQRNVREIVGTQNALWVGYRIVNDELEDMFSKPSTVDFLWGKNQPGGLQL